jgi:hypothetical protein
MQHHVDRFMLNAQMVDISKQKQDTAIPGETCHACGITRVL